MNSPSITSSPSSYDNFHNNGNKHKADMLSLQKELQDKQHELAIAYQTSLELVETNTELQNQLNEQMINVQQLDLSITEYETKVDLLEAENQEYQQTINQANERYEEALSELAVSRDHLYNAQVEIEEYQRTIQTLNHDIIHNATDNTLQNESNQQDIDIGQGGNEGIDYKDKMEKQQKKYDELLRECEKYRNEHEQLIEYQIEIENMRKDALKFEKRNKLLSDQIVELTYNNVQLEKEINEYNVELEENQETIQFLENENEKLLTSNANMADNEQTVNGNDMDNVSKVNDHKISSITIAGTDTILDKFVMNEEAKDESDDMDEDEDLFTIHENYEDNEEYLDHIDNMANGTGTDDGDGDHGVESVSELSNALKQILDEVKEDDKKEKEEKSESKSPKRNDSRVMSILKWMSSAFNGNTGVITKQARSRAYVGMMY